jgi:hypothetical protein
VLFNYSYLISLIRVVHFIEVTVLTYKSHLIIKFSNSSSSPKKKTALPIFPSGLVLLILYFWKNLSQRLPISYKPHNQLKYTLFVIGYYVTTDILFPLKAAFSFKRSISMADGYGFPIKLKLDAGPSTVFSPLLGIP